MRQPSRAGASQPAIARLEQGRRSPSLVTLARLVEAAGFQLRLQLVPAPHPDLPWLIRVKRAAGRPKDLEVLAELEALGEEIARRDEET